MSSASSSPPETVLCCSCRQKCYPTSQWSSGWRWPTLVPNRCLYHTATCTCPDSKSSLVSLWEQLRPQSSFFLFYFFNSIHFGFSQFCREITQDVQVHAKAVSLLRVLQFTCVLRGSSSALMPPLPSSSTD